MFITIYFLGFSLVRFGVIERMDREVRDFTVDAIAKRGQADKIKYYEEQVEFVTIWSM